MSKSGKTGSSHRRTPVRVGALLMLAMCFLASAFIRAGEVIAALPEGGDDGFGNPVAVPEPQTAQQDAKTPAPRMEAPEAVVLELKRQREMLAARKSEMDVREQTLKALEKKLRERLDELRAARERLRETASVVDDAAGKDVRRLAEMYQQMKPKQAGQIFNEMAPSFAAGFVAEMRPDAAALIMANMDAAKAYAVSLLLAGRNVASPTAAAE